MRLTRFAAGAAALVLFLFGAPSARAEGQTKVKPCPAGQVHMQKPDGTWVCFGCPTGQFPLLSPGGKWICVSQASNPCDKRSVLVVSAAGVASCRDNPSASVKCPTGQIPVQNAAGQWVCGAPLCPCGWKAAPPSLVPADGSACVPGEPTIACPPGTHFFREGSVIGCKP